VRIAVLVSDDVPWAFSLARTWAADDDEVTLVLLDTAVASARAGSSEEGLLAGALGAGIAILAEERALQRRVLDPRDIVDGVKVLRLDELADLLVDDSDKAVWL
jgi:predicted peroxiredoxin